MRCWQSWLAALLDRSPNGNYVADFPRAARRGRGHISLGGALRLAAQPDAFQAANGLKLDRRRPFLRTFIVRGPVASAASSAVSRGR